jgi:dephospho-CoA kinase
MEWSAAHRNDAYTIYESALLFESGFYKHFEHSVLVTAPVELCMKRVLIRDGMKETDFRNRLARQMDENKKSELADHIISNDEQTPLIPRIIDLHNIFIAG